MKIAKDYKLSEQYWQTKLSGTLQKKYLSQLPLISPGKPNGFGKFKVRIPDEKVKDLLEVCGEDKKALKVILLALLKLMVFRYTENDDVLIAGLAPDGSTKSYHPILYRERVSEETDLKSFLNQVKKGFIESIANAEFAATAFEKIKKLSGKSPISNVELMFCLDVEKASYSTTEIADLIFVVGRKNNELSLTISYDQSKFELGFLQSFVNNYIYLIGSFKQNLPNKLASIRLNAPEEDYKIITDFNATNTSVKSNTLAGIFEDQVKLTPDNIALYTKDKKVTYNELNERANRFANFLRAQHLDHNELIPVIMDRSIDMIVAIFGILKCGAAYVPIEPDIPGDRIANILESLDISRLVTSASRVDKLEAIESKCSTSFKINYFGGRVTKVDGDKTIDVEPHLPNYEKANLNLKISADTIAYIIHTSGSTGKPKGVVVKHSPVINIIDWVNKTFAISEQDKLLFVTSLSFDLSVYDIFGILSSGASLYVASFEELKDPYELLNLIREQSITFWDSAPAAFQQLVPFLNHAKQASFGDTLRLVFFSGDWIPLKLPVTIRDNFPNASVISLGGATEATIWSNYYPIDSIHASWKSIPYGKPIQNAAYYILDKQLKTCPIGVKGDLYIGGDCLADGYINDKALSSTKFINNPFRKGGKIYKTGDLARWYFDGNMEFLGRQDFQVKIRGHRIELGEIEYHLNKFEGVQRAVAHVFDFNDNKQLVAYFTEESPVETEKFKEFLSSKLPDYMVPVKLVKLDKLPLTSNGKVNLKALPHPNQIDSENLVPARNDTDTLIIEAWANALKIDANKIGIDTNFFELGGHSIKATAIIARIYQELKITIPLSQMFKVPTVRALADFCDASSPEKEIPFSTTKQAEHYVLSSAQKRFYLMQQFDKESIGYNMPTFIKLYGEIDKVRFETAFCQLVERHESLRTSFHMIDGTPIQKVNESRGVAIEYTNTALEYAAVDYQQLSADFVKPFDLTNAPLLRVKLVSFSTNQHILLLDIHHIISDGITMRLLIDEFVSLYEGKSLSDTHHQYKDYAVWQQTSEEVKSNLSNQASFWLSTLPREVDHLELATDFTRPAIKSFHGDQVNFTFDSDTTKRMKALAANANVTLYTLLLAAFNVLLYRLSGKKDILIGSPVSGRKREEFQSIAGVFVNTVVLRNQLNVEESFSSFLKSVNTNALMALENSDLPFEDVVELLNIPPSMERNPLFEIMYVYDESESKDEHTSSLQVDSIQTDETIAKFDLTLNINVRQEVTCSFQYCKDLFRVETIQQYANYLQNILGEILQENETKIKDIDLLSFENKRELLSGFNPQKSDIPNNKTVLDFFDDQVKKHPEKTAISFKGKQYTYAQLNTKADNLARHLRHCGVRQKDFVGILLERSPEFIISMVAVLKTGGVYVPLDVSYPKERLDYIVSDCKAKVLISNEINAGLVDEQFEIVDYDNCVDSSVKLSSNPKPSVDDLIYLIYTSGSTGRPKGVMVKHEGIVNLIKFHQQLFNDNTSSRFSQTASPGFDAMAFEVWPALASGASIIMTPDDVKRDPEKWKNWCCEEAITIGFQSTAIAEKLIQMEWPATTNLKHLRTAGDSLKVNLRRHLPFHCYNLYGPTEDTIWTTFKKLETENESASLPSIGQPIANKNVYILNDELNLQPIGIPGEICISGPGVAKGYLNKEDLTSENFIPNPFGDHMLYKTGDLGKWLHNGEIQFLGRLDDQVKIRGFRIEIGEIVHHLENHAKVNVCHVVNKVDKFGANFLSAYVIVNEEVSPSELTTYLKGKLPLYMVPAYVIRLDQFPLNSHGKIDTSALPDPSCITQEKYVAPSGKTEQILVDIWKQILDRKKIGTNDNFFEIGGNSLKILQVADLMKSCLDVEDPVMLIFQFPTIKSLANYLTNESNDLLKDAIRKEKKIATGKEKLLRLKQKAKPKALETY